MFHDFPYTDFHELNLDYLMCLCRKSMGLKLDVQGDLLRLVNGQGEVVSSVTISYAEKALTDVDGKPIQTYIFDAGVNGRTLVFTHGDNTVTTITVPYATAAKEDISGRDIQDYIYNLQVAGEKLRLTKGDGTIVELTVPFATMAENDHEGNDLTTYACTLTVDGDTLVLRDRKGRLLNQITVPYATRALNDGNGDEIEASYGDTLSAGTTTIKLIAKDGTELSEITVPYATEANHAASADFATLAEDANNAVENVAIVGDQIVFTTFDNAQFAMTIPYAVKAQKDDLGNVIKSSYVANVTQNIQTGEISFLDALGNTIVSLTPTASKATYDSYNNLIADFIKTIVVSNDSNYVTVTHGTGTVDSLQINYSNHAWKDTNENVIKNTYIKYMECIEDVNDGHYKLVCYDGDNPMAELFRLEIYAYAAQCDVNGRELTTYVGNVLVDADDSEILDVVDGEDTVTNQISGAVTIEPSGTVNATASGTAVTLTAGTLPSVSYNAATETLIFSAGVFPAVDTVTDPSISASFTGDSETENIVFSDSL